MISLGDCEKEDHLLIPPRISSSAGEGVGRPVIIKVNGYLAIFKLIFIKKKNHLAGYPAVLDNDRRPHIISSGYPTILN